VENNKSQKPKALKYLACGFGIAVVLLVLTAMTYSYSEDPDFCGGCHAMGDHYMSWQISTHNAVTCSECHLPQDGLVTKLVAKAQTGVVDVYSQAAGKAPLSTDLSITAKGKDILQANCIRCHGATVMQVSIIDRNLDCNSCHRNLVHKND
jgi:cytochrome c nitrite reductase small subunit